MKKIFNYRPLVSMALFLIAGIVFMCGILSGSVFHYVLSALMLIALIATIIVKCVTKTEKLLFKVLSIVICFVVSSVSSFAILYSYDNQTSLKGEYSIIGTVCADSTISSDSKYILLIDDVTATSVKTGESYKIKRKVRLYLESGDGRVNGLKLGDEISATLSMTSASLKYNGTRNYYLYNKRISALGFGSEEDINITGKSNATIFDKFKIKVEETLDKYLSEDYSSLGYTMLFGDKAELSETIADNYSASGISHLLAVSGLHVGFIVTILSLILSLFKAGRKFKFYFISIILFLYAMMCGFTVSVTRALIMTVVMLFCKMKFKEYDGLSSLSFAAIIILIINPLQIYDIGFRLSFCAVLGIMLLSPVFTRIFDTFLHRKLASSFAVALSATIGTLPIMCLSFDKISIFSVVANMILIPIASVAFMFMFVFVLIAMIIPAFGVFLYVFELLMSVVTILSSVLGAWSLAGASSTYALIFTVLILANCLVFSDYLFIEKKRKIIYSSVLCVLCVVSFVIMFI